MFGGLIHIELFQHLKSERNQSVYLFDILTLHHRYWSQPLAQCNVIIIGSNEYYATSCNYKYLNFHSIRTTGCTKVRQTPILLRLRGVACGNKGGRGRQEGWGEKENRGVRGRRT